MYGLLWTGLSLLVHSTGLVAYAQSNSGWACYVDNDGFTLAGVSDNGACRYVIKYGQAERWAYSTMAETLNSSLSLPPACPQNSSLYVNTTQSEDCLYTVLYTPGALPTTPTLPVFVWIHGGSSIQGSAGALGLDGARLASAGNMIVVVAQYRLGVLGFVPPTQAVSTADPNLGLLDVITLLTSMQDNIHYLGGDPSKITIGGQSSGAGMVRALLAAPSAKGMFRAAILQSDPMTYGFATENITSQLQTAVYSQSALSSCSTLSCLQALPVSDLLTAQDSVIASSPTNITGIPFAEVIRPTFGPASLPNDPAATLNTNPAQLSSFGVPLLITTVANDGGQATEQLFPSLVPPSNQTYEGTFAYLVGQARAQNITQSDYYALPPNGDGDQLRETFERATTDGTWRCPCRDAARSYANAGGKAYVGEWSQGVTYPTNANGSYCTAYNRVCHEDDIYPTFDDSPNASSATVSLQNQVNQYWISFITISDPGGGWPLYTSDSAGAADVQQLGVGAAVGSCPSGFWGTTAKYDWQLYG